MANLSATNESVADALRLPAIPAWLEEFDHDRECPSIDLMLLTPVVRKANHPVLQQWIQVWNSALEKSYALPKAPAGLLVSTLEQSGDQFYLSAYGETSEEKLFSADLNLEEGAECVMLFLLSMRH